MGPIGAMSSFGCAMIRFEDVSFPLEATENVELYIGSAIHLAFGLGCCSDTLWLLQPPQGWPSAVRAEGGRSLYGAPSCLKRNSTRKFQIAYDFLIFLRELLRNSLHVHAEVLAGRSGC